MKHYSLVLISFLFIFCSDKKTSTEIKVQKKIIETSKEFSNYWYDGTAEITSYKLSQFRYGEIHEGTAVTIFVTEPFLPKEQVKADYQNKQNIPVLKLNSTKKFITGIYPYSIMTSTFSPINRNEQAIKISFSSQEWCGNTFAQLNNRNDFVIDYHSYFESNADRKLILDKNILENEIWNLIRISPKNLPIGEIKMIPSFEDLALNHKEIRAYKAITSIQKLDSTYRYAINFTSLKRELKITFNNTHPYQITSWEEKLNTNGTESITKASEIKSIKSKYWSKNANKHRELRKEIGI